MPATATMPKKSKPRTTRPVPTCKVIWFPNRGSGTFTSDRKDTTLFRRTIRGEWGDYILAVPHGSPLLLIGETEIAAFAPDLKAGSAREVEIPPTQIESIVRQLCDDALATEFEALQTAADELLSVSEELAEVKRQLASANQQIASFKNPHADAPPG